MMSTRSRTFVAAVRPWLWWSTFVVARQTGSDAHAAFKAAQRETAKLQARARTA